MAKLVLLHRADSIYDDEPDSVYDFPRAYLNAVQSAVGDWIVYYEPVKAGPRGYFATARIGRVDPHPRLPDRFLARIAPGSFLPVDRNLPRLINGRPLETALAEATGLPMRGGLTQSAVRALPDRDFARIIDLGLPPDLEHLEATRYDPPGAAEPATPFQRPTLERLTRRAYRDAAFRRLVRGAYDDRCAMSGLRLRNGGGRPEVQAAHIRPVDSQGSASIRIGLALSGTLHWMFDRGLVSMAEDHAILVSHNQVPAEVVDRLILPDRKLRLPADAHHWPHPANLRWHRENVFGQHLTDESPPW